MAGVLGVITRLRNPLLASLRDSPKPRPTGVTRDELAMTFLDPGSWVLGPGTETRVPAMVLEYQRNGVWG